MLAHAHQSPKYTYLREDIGVTECKGSCESVEFVVWCIMDLVIKVDIYWCDVGRPSSCNASQLPHFLVIFVIDSSNSSCSSNH